MLGVDKVPVTERRPERATKVRAKGTKLNVCTWFTLWRTQCCCFVVVFPPYPTHALFPLGPSDRKSLTQGLKVVRRCWRGVFQSEASRTSGSSNSRSILYSLGRPFCCRNFGFVWATSPQTTRHLHRFTLPMNTLNLFKLQKWIDQGAM